jgi:hypothetical protein
MRAAVGGHAPCQARDQRQAGHVGARGDTQRALPATPQAPLRRLSTVCASADMVPTLTAFAAAWRGCGLASLQRRGELLKPAANCSSSAPLRLPTGARLDRPFTRSCIQRAGRSAQSVCTAGTLRSASSSEVTRTADRAFAVTGRGRHRLAQFQARNVIASAGPTPRAWATG